MPDRVPWYEFVPRFFSETNYRQGQHVLAMAKTGQGKTLLLTSLLTNAVYIGAFEAVLWTKPRDKELNSFYRRTDVSKKIISKADFNFAKPREQLVVVRPKTQNLAQLKSVQKTVFTQVIEQIWSVGNWLIYLDELRYFTQTLSITDLIQLLYTQARSSGISLWAGVQRPKWISVEARTETSHFFLAFPGQGIESTNKSGASEDMIYLKRMFGSEAVSLIETLPQHSFLYIGPNWSAIVKVGA